MLGHSDEFGKNRYFITGPEFSNLQDIIVEFNKGKEWQIADAGEIVSMLFKTADNYSFVEYANRNNFCVPVHTIATSICMDSHIHELHDEVEYIDFENLSNAVENITQLILYLSDKSVVIKCNY